LLLPFLHVLDDNTQNMSSAAKISQVLNSNLTKNKLEEAFRLGSTSPGLCL